MEVNVTGKTKGFIDVSRAARVRRNLSVLSSSLERLEESASDPQVQSQRSQSLRRLDQGLGDLIRIVRGPSGSAVRRDSRARARRAGR